MSRVVIDAREWSSSTGRYIRNLVSQLEGLALNDEFIVLLKPADLEKYVPSNPNFTKQACGWKEFTFEEQAGFKRQLDNLNADLVHFGMAHQPISYRGRSVTTIHDLTTLRYINPVKNPVIFRLKRRVYRYVIKRVSRKSKALITPTNFVKKDLIRFTQVPEDKVTVTYEAADTIPGKAVVIDELSADSFIMYIGRATPHKNLLGLVEAFALLAKDHPDLKLVLGGNKDANYQRIDNFAKNKSIKNVVFTSRVSEEELKWLYQNCLAYVFPSLSEGFGLPGLEAMAHGAPVVSSKATCLPEIYGKAAHYFDPNDVRAMAQAINDVLIDSQLRQTLIKAGGIQVKRYSWRKMAEQTLDVYKKALS